MTLVTRSCWFRGADEALLHFDVVDAGESARGAIVTLHGLGEHVAKYSEWFDRVVDAGWHATGYDQRGHGETPGRRGDFEFSELVRDLDRFLDVTRDRYPAVPIFVVAHSLGALVALSWADREEAPGIAGLVVSSPPLALSAEKPGWYRWGVRALSRTIPRIPLPRGTDPDRLTRDPERRRAIEEDERIHGVMTPRAMVSAAEAMRDLASRVPDIGVPALVLAAGDDRVVDADAALAWARAIEGDVTVERVAGAYHELLNDLGREGVYDRILEWCDARA